MAKKQEEDVQLKGQIVSKRERTPFQESVAKRAKELMAQGVPMAQAAQQAYAELAQPAESNLEAANRQAQLESEKGVESLERSRQAYIEQRQEVLQKQGIQGEDARQRAETEFEEQYLKPVVSPYGELKERAPKIGIDAAPPTSLPSGVTGAEPTFMGALRPQTFLPESAAALEKERMKAPAVGGIAGAGPDWSKIQKSFEDEGVDPDSAGMQTSALRRAYEIKAQSRLQDLQKQKKPVPDDFANKVWKDTVADIGALPSALADEAKYVKEQVKGGPADPLYMAFSKQIKEGKGVPQLTKSQGAYVASLAESERKKAEERLRAEYANKPLEVTETEAVEGIRGARPRTVTRVLSGPEKEAEIRRMAAAEVETPWWTDPKEVERRLASPEKFTKPGVFGSETAFGTQRESDVGYLLRAAMAPLNAIAGAAFPLAFTGFDEETRAAVEEARRRARPEVYKDSPVLLNIAEGRGFVGEASELAKLTGLDADKVIGNITLGDIYTAGAFAADLLDPSLDILAGVSRGAKTAKQIQKVGKQLKLPGTTELAAKEGAKEVIKTVAIENPALNLVAKRAGVANGDVRLALSELAARQAESAVGVGRARPAVAANAPEIVKSVDSTLASLDNVINPSKAKTGKVLGKNELANAIAEASARDVAIGTAVKNAYNNRIPVKELLRTDDAVYEATQRALINQATRKNVFAATADTVLKSGIVAVTKNTLATKDVADKILKTYAKQSDFIKNVVPEIRKNYNVGTKLVRGPSGLPGAARQAVVVDGFNITPQQFQKLREEVNTLAAKRVLNKQQAEALRQVLQDTPTFIPSESLRTIIDAGIDDVANGFKVVKGADVAELSPLAAREITKPLELKDFGLAGLKEWSIDKAIRRPTEALTPAQKGIVETVTAKLNKLDVGLRNDMSRIIKDENFRSAYGIPAGQKLTRKQLMGYLITGPQTRARGPIIDSSLKLAVDKVVKAKGYKQDIFDLFSGVKLDELTDVWSQKGRLELNTLITDAKRIISPNPETYYDELAKLIEGAKALVSDPTNLKVDISEIKLPKTDVSNEALIASYYNAESNRIMRQALDDILTQEAGFINKDYSDNLSRPIGNKIGGQQGFGEAVANYIQAVTIDPRFEAQTLEDKVKAIASPAIVAGLRDDEAALFLAQVAETAGSVMKNNSILIARDGVGEVMDLVKAAAKKGGALEANLKAMLGTDVAKQIQTAFESGGAGAIENGLNAVFKDAAEGYVFRIGKIPPIEDWPGRFVDAINNAFYTLLLTAAPRFHGANIIGAPSAIYSTTGKLISPFPIPGTSTFDALRVMKDGGTSKGGRLIKTPGGRAYTANEIYNAIVKGGGSTVLKPQVPAISARDALAQLTEGVAGGLERGFRTVLETPQYEDTLYRMAVALESLNEGRTLEEATQLARAALYDNGTIADAEKALSRSIMFYSFTRNNLVNLLKNMMKPEGIKRIINTAKFKRGIEEFTVDKDEAKYLPSTAATRVVLGRGQDIDTKGTIIATPSDSTLSAIELLSTIISLDIAGILQGAMKPGQALLYGAGEEREIEQIPADHMNIYLGLADITGADVNTILEALTGEKVVPVRSNSPEAINGFIYPILSEKARKRYTLTMNALAYTGIQRIMSDYPNSFRAPGSKVANALAEDNVGYGLTALYAAGMISPLKTLSAEQQRMRQLMTQSAEGKKLAKDIDDILLKDKLAVAPGDVEGVGARVEAGKAKKVRGKLGISEISKEKLRLKSEIEALKAQIRQDPARERRAIYIGQIREKAARIAELSKLEAEAKK